MWEHLLPIITKLVDAFGPVGFVSTVTLAAVMWVFAPILRDALKRERGKTEDEKRALREAHERRDKREEALLANMQFLVAADLRREKEAERHAELLDKLERRTHDSAVAMTNAMSDLRREIRRS